MKSSEFIWGLLRLSMGWIFLWPFIDKVFGLGFATEAGKGWIDGGSPTAGFLKFGTKGPFVEFFQNLAGSAFVDWIFMIGLLAIGLALILGVFVRIAALAGVMQLVLMYLAAFIPPENNPFLDEHLIYALILIGLLTVNSGAWLGIGKWWGSQKFVKNLPILK